MCNCQGIEIGSYDNQVTLDRPNHMIGRKEGSQSDKICIDKCIAQEVKHLWNLGISTTGCCCGHNERKGFIGVVDEDIRKMKSLGYRVQYNPLRPDSEDTFDIKGIDKHKYVEKNEINNIIIR